MIKKLINNLEKNPKKLFLIDGMGAVTSAFMLGIVLVRFEYFFGIPSNVLHFLAGVPICYLAYDIYSYFKGDHNIGFLLKGIAIMNILYCCVSLLLAFNHIETITIWGWIYIVIEIIILVILAGIQFNVAKKHGTKLNLKT